MYERMVSALHEPEDARREDIAPESRIQELERLIEEKRKEETAARDNAAKQSAKLRGMDKEGGSNINPHKTSSLLAGLALGILKGGLQAVNDIQRETAEKELRDAEAAEEQARTERRSLEAELDRERRTFTGGT